MRMYVKSCVRMPGRGERGIMARWLSATACLVCVVAGVSALLALDVYRVASASMEPTLRCSGTPGCTSTVSDRVFVFRWPSVIGGIEHGDIVAIRGAPGTCVPEGVLLKRVVALNGDWVTIERATGAITVTRKKLAYLRSTRVRRLYVPPGQYFVVGDNRTFSCDSRSFGVVPASRIEGKVILTL